MAVRQLKRYASWVQTVQHLIARPRLAEWEIERSESTRKKDKSHGDAIQECIEVHQLISVESYSIVYGRTTPKERFNLNLPLETEC